MNILICNERFLFRFGVDRVLLILIKHLLSNNHKVTILANKVDEKVVAELGCQSIVMPECPDYLESNEFTRKWLEENHEQIGKDYDVAFIAGWPFFLSIDFFKSCGMKVAFLDCGAAPHEGLQGGQLLIQKKHKKLRRDNLQYLDLIIGISDFIIDTQSLPDSKRVVPVKTILLGANHMQMKLWEDDNTTTDKSGFDKISKQLSDNEYKKIFLTGRWEAGNYKSSDESFEIMRNLKESFNKIKLFVLAKDDEIAIPDDLMENIIPLGYISDENLDTVMSSVDLAICVSKWEGFNLPLAELQWLHIPTLSYDVGAHPEVIGHPWYLCRSITEIAEKAVSILHGKGLPKDISEEIFDVFCSNFMWEDVCKKYTAALIQIAEESYSNSDYVPELKNRVDLVVDVTNATKDPANSGVIRVTRRLTRELQRTLNPIFVIWENNQYVFPNENEYAILGSFNGPLLLNDCYVSSVGERVILDDYFAGNNKIKWLLCTEIIRNENAVKIQAYANSRNMHTMSIFYDAIPIITPEYCNDEVTQNHKNYMVNLVKQNVIMPISDFSKQCLIEFWQQGNIAGNVVETNQLSAEFEGSKRVVEKSTLRDEVKILCVCTLEPRKNHKTLLDAFVSLMENNKELNISLTLVGNRYAGYDDVPDYISRLQGKYDNLEWLGIVDDDTLGRLYNECTFTVYPSIIEGFGMPIIESVWHGKPCICNEVGVMSELVAEGGCIAVDTLDAQKLYEAMYNLATDKDLYEMLSKQAAERYIKLWSEYAQQTMEIIYENTYALRNNVAFWNDKISDIDISEAQKAHRLDHFVLNSIIKSHAPTCCVVIGESQSGCLPLISKSSDLVFSLDLDENVEQEYSYLDNVIYLTGPAYKLLPKVFDELEQRQIPIDFILMGSTVLDEGGKKAIESILSYVPLCHMIMMIHGVSSPECSGKLSSIEWNSSKYLDFVDINFLKDNNTEHDGICLVGFRPEESYLGYVTVNNHLLNEDEALAKIQKTLGAKTSNDSTEELVAKLDYLNNNWIIDPNQQLASTGGMTGKAKTFIKRMFRKCLRWYVAPPHAQQTQYNMNNTIAINIMSNLLKEANQRIDELERRVNSRNNER